MITASDKKYLLDKRGYDNHEAVYKITDESCGLKAFISIHNTNLGAAVGGTRMVDYNSENEALEDVLRLSRAMTYKCALAGIKNGGGKGVIIGNSQKEKTPELIRAYAKAVGELNGKFYTGEDVGISKSDVQDVMLKESPYFIGKNGLAEDPSPFAALSVFYSMKVAVKEVYGQDDLRGLTIAIKGLGKIGGELANLVIKDGAKIIVSDINPIAVKNILEKYPKAVIVDTKEILRAKADVYAPCALGDEFTEDNYMSIRGKIVCGGANNQLHSLSIGDKLYSRGIIYVPDYIANSGGLIDVADELEVNGFDYERVEKRILGVKNTVKKVIDLSVEKGESTCRVADLLAEEIIYNK